MKALSRTLLPLALSMAATYFLDPQSGRRRRARVADQAISLAHQFYDGLGAAGRDLGYRTRGILAETLGVFRRDHADDKVIAERVRATLGRVVSHPSNIHVESHEGYILLKGDILTQEYAALLQAVQKVRGVKGVSDHLAVYDSASGISSLQGGRPRQPPRFELMQDKWSPAARLIMGTAGGALMLYGLQRKGLLSALSFAAGGACVLRSSTNASLRRLAGAQGRRAIDVHKTLIVHSPVERVFELLDHYENFPFFMRNVREVRTHEDGRSHWTVAGPAGVSIEWDSVTTVRRPNEVLAWRTVPNATVAHAGIIRLRPAGENRTQLDIHMSYNPPAGALGHVIAKLFRSDPKTELDEDLMRTKHFLETGHSPRDAAAQNTPAAATSATSPQQRRTMQ